jgi:hypothetical protein
LTFSGQSIGQALQNLRKFHGQDTKDGYTIIVKAANLLHGTLAIEEKKLSSIGMAAVFKDNILRCKALLDIFFVIVVTCYGNP